MKRDSFTKYLYWGVTVFLVICASILFFFSLFKLPDVIGFFKTLTGILMPFVYGLTLAYLLNPIFNFLYDRFAPFLQKHLKNKRRAVHLAKFLSTFLSVALALLIVAALLSMVLPEVVSSIIGLSESNLFVDRVADVTAWFDHFLKQYPNLESAAERVYVEAVSVFDTWLKNDMVPQLTNLMSGLLGTLTFIKNIFIAIIITIYVLNSKQLFAAQSKKMLYSILDVHRANIILNNMRFTNKVFGGFINGKLLDSLIIGILCFLGMTLFGMPYAMLVSVIIGVTNIIPFFGPFIGAIPSILLILLIDPLKALYFALFVLVLQQFDGNILGPKILGDSTGISGFWVMFAILLAGGLFGFVGMVVGVPLFAVFYNIVSGLVCHSLRKKGIPEQTQAYYGLESVDEQTFRPHYTGEPDDAPEHGCPDGTVPAAAEAPAPACKNEGGTH